MLRDGISKIKQVSALLPAVRTADANGIGIDLKGYDAAQMVGYIGAPGDTLSGSVKIELELQHSDDNSTFVACADADLSAAVTGTNTGTFAVIDANGEASLSYAVGYMGSKRYIRIVSNVTGTHTNGTPSAALAILSEAHAVPV